MNVEFKVGDVLEEAVDVLISTANPQLNLSGGVNGAILARGGEALQEELWSYVRRSGKPIVDPGSVIRTGGGPLAVKHILHAVAVDVFYGSSIALVRKSIESALTLAVELGALTVAMPALATGYGPLSMDDFAPALTQSLQRDWSPISELRVVLRRAEDVRRVRAITVREDS